MAAAAVTVATFCVAAATVAVATVGVATVGVVAAALTNFAAIALWLLYCPWYSLHPKTRRPRQDVILLPINDKSDAQNSNPRTNNNNDHQ